MISTDIPGVANLHTPGWMVINHNQLVPMGNVFPDAAGLRIARSHGFIQQPKALASG